MAIIKAARRITWLNNVGVSGGIPTNYTQHGSTIAATGDATDRTAEINAAILAAAIAGPDHYVKLGPGSFTISSSINLYSFTALRGSGMSASIITGACELIRIYEYQAYADNVAIVGSPAKGATSITLASAPAGLGEGMVVQVVEANDARVVAGLEQGGSAIPFAMGQWVKITDDSAKPTYAIDPPLYSEYKSANSPFARYTFLNAGGTSRNLIRRAGVEDLKLVNTATGAVNNIYVGFAEECWIKNVWSVDGSQSHLWLFDTFRMEVRGCVFDGVIGAITSSRGYGIQTGTPNGSLPPSKTTAALFEDNTFVKTRSGLLIGYGTAGCVIAYNYFAHMISDAIYPDPGPHQKPGIDIHSSFCVMNLFEGNVVKGFGMYADMDHGNSYWNTIVRNWFQGHEDGKTAGLLGISIAAFHREYNIIGNVLGHAGIMAAVAGYGSTAYKRAIVGDADPFAYGNSDFAALHLGYDGIGGGTTMADVMVALTAAIHGNYDYVTPAGREWALNNDNVEDYTDQVIPDSYFRSSKPSWFGNLDFPPIKPDAPPSSDTVIPAAWRYINGNEDYLDLTPQVAAPQFSPVAGLYYEAQSVTISTVTAGATIRYTTDGSEPTPSHGTIVAGPVSVPASVTLKARAYNGVDLDSDVVTAVYEIVPPVVAPVSKGSKKMLGRRR